MKHSIFTAKIAKTLFCAALSVAATSCLTTKKEPLSINATSQEIVQAAQTALDEGKTEDALKYYDTLLKRYGMNTAVYVEGRYEAAHIYVKQKKYDLAKPILEEIVQIYDSSQPGALPGAFKKLAENDLKKINSGSKN